MLLEGHKPAAVAAAADYNEAALVALGVCGPSGSAAKVAIGFVDYGFDLLHPTLRDAVTGRSRFACLWDQNSSRDVARDFAFDPEAAVDFDRAWIDREVTSALASGSRRALDEIYDPHANNCGRHGTVGGAHGTMMASIAAGSPVAGFRGAAPDAVLMGVQLALADQDWKEEDAAGAPGWLDWRSERDRHWQGWLAYDECAQIANGVRYLHDRACRLGIEALVVNLSLGAWAGSHCGSSPLESALARVIQAADTAFRAGAGPRMVVVVGAGNAGADDGHWQGLIRTGQSTSFDWLMQRGDPTQNKLEIWYEGGPIDVSVALPNSANMSIEPGATRELLVGGRRVGIAEHDIACRGSLSRVRILVHPPLLSEAIAAVEGSADIGASLCLSAAATARLHAWIERDDGTAERSWLSPSHPESSLCCLAAVAGAVVVGGYDHRAMATTENGCLPLSGVGPLPWGEGTDRMVPHVVAPARQIWGARSKTRGFVATTGTSAAVALASGAVARHLSVRGAAAPLPIGRGRWNARTGHGPLDLKSYVANGVST